ncbi:hypothetical protein MJK72_05565 [Klebsiella pneumoniae]|nr:hypothetical protein MJK72_05565 [Klebsiella pneumoniae]
MQTLLTPCRTPSGSAETQSAAGGKVRRPAAALRRRAGVRRGMPRWLWALLAGANSVLDHRDPARQAEAAQQARPAFYHR